MNKYVSCLFLGLLLSAPCYAEQGRLPLSLVEAAAAIAKEEGIDLKLSLTSLQGRSFMVWISDGEKRIQLTEGPAMLLS